MSYRVSVFIDYIFSHIKFHIKISTIQSLYISCSYLVLLFCEVYIQTVQACLITHNSGHIYFFCIFTYFIYFTVLPYSISTVMYTNTFIQVLNLLTWMDGAGMGGWMGWGKECENGKHTLLSLSYMLPYLNTAVAYVTFAQTTVHVHNILTLFVLFSFL